MGKQNFLRKEKKILTTKEKNKADFIKRKIFVL